MIYKQFKENDLQITEIRLKKEVVARYCNSLSGNCQLGILYDLSPLLELSPAKIAEILHAIKKQEDIHKPLILLYIEEDKIKKFKEALTKSGLKSVLTEKIDSMNSYLYIIRKT